MKPNERCHEIVKQVLMDNKDRSTLFMLEAAARKAYAAGWSDYKEAVAKAINVGDLAPKEYGHPTKWKEGYRAALIEANDIIRSLPTPETHDKEG